MKNSLEELSPEEVGKLPLNSWYWQKKDLKITEEEKTVQSRFYNTGIYRIYGYFKPISKIINLTQK